MQFKIEDIRNTYFADLNDRIDFDKPSIDLKTDEIKIYTGVLNIYGDDITLYLTRDKNGFILSDDGHIVSDLKHELGIDLAKVIDQGVYREAIRNANIEDSKLTLRFDLLDDLPLYEDRFKQIISQLQIVALLQDK